MRTSWSPLRLTSNERVPALLGVLFVAVYAALTLYVGLHHEPWRDEADAWLLARDAPLDAILSWTHNAGTPALWYVILKVPAAALHLPYVAETVVNLALSWAAAAVLVFCAPFTRLTKLLVLTSYFFAYEYSVIARSYSLTILLLFLAIAALPKRPLAFAVAVAMLANTNVHGAVLAAILFVMFMKRSRATAPVIVMVCGGLIALIQLFPPEAIGAVRHVRLYAVPTALGDAFLPGVPVIFAVAAGLAVFATIAVATRSAFLLISTGALLAIYTFVWFGGLRHSGLILVVTLASVWLGREVPAARISRVAALLLNLTLFGSSVYAYVNAADDVRWAFSGSREMARFIDHRFDDCDIAAHNMFAAEALLPYLPGRRFWYAGLGQYGTFLPWNESQSAGAEMPYEVALRNAQKHFRGKKWLFLVNSRMPNPEQHGFRLIHATSVVVFRHLDERYWLYAPL